MQPHTDPAPTNTNQYRLLLTQFYHVSTSSALYWPSNIIYQPVLPHTDTVSSCINQCHPIMTIKMSDTLWKKSFSHNLFPKINCRTLFCRHEMSTDVRKSSSFLQGNTSHITNQYFSLQMSCIQFYNSEISCFKQVSSGHCPLCFSICWFNTRTCIYQWW